MMAKLSFLGQAIHLNDCSYLYPFHYKEWPMEVLTKPDSALQQPKIPHLGHQAITQTENALKYHLVRRFRVQCQNKIISACNRFHTFTSNYYP